MTDTFDIRDNTAEHRYEMDVDGEMAVLEYRRIPGAIELVHTEVPESLRGRGLSSVIIRHALDAAKAGGDRVIPSCPTVRSYVRRHKEYLPLLHR